MAEYISHCGAFDVVAAGEGPGSYTGLRAALALASGLSLARQIPLVTVSALYGLVPDEVGLFHAMIDARSGGVYFLQGEKEEEISFVGRPGKKPVEEITLLDFVVSPVIKPLREKFKDAVRYIEKMPEATEIIRHVEERLDAGNYSLSGEAELLYLGRTL